MRTKRWFYPLLVVCISVILHQVRPYVSFRQLDRTVFSKSRWVGVLPMVNPKPSGFAGSRKGKEKVVEKTTPLIDGSYFLAVLPIKGASKEAIDSLRDLLPPETTATVIKNSVMKICIQSAVSGKQFLPLTEDLSDENMFLFIKEGFSAPSYRALQKWLKDTGRDGRDDYAIKSCVVEGSRYIGEQQVSEVLRVTSKSDLLAELVHVLEHIPMQFVQTLMALSDARNQTTYTCATPPTTTTTSTATMDSAVAYGVNTPEV